MTARRLACLLALAALLLSPGASAFATRQEALVLTYDQAAAPVVIAMGALSMEGTLAGGLVAFGAAGLALEDVPELTIVEQDANGLPRNTTHADATLTVHEGALVWRFPDEGRLRDVAWSASYGMGLSLPQAPLPQAEGEDAAGFLLAAPELSIAGAWSGEASELILVDAVVTLTGADGRAVEGWERRPVNEGVSASEPDPESFDALFSVSGAFPVSGRAGLVGGAGGSSELALAVATAEEDGFEAALAHLDTVGAQLAGDQPGGPFGAENPLRALAPFSGVLNGALLIVAQGENGTAPEPTQARLGEDPFDAGPMSLLRSDDLQVAWRDDEVAVQGTPVLAISRAGVAVEEPASLGIVPVLSLVLWLAALGAIVFFFVRRPPKGNPAWTLRLASMGVHLVVFLVVFVLWDASFAETFGTSVLTVFGAHGLAQPGQLGSLLALQMMPWGLAALFFALPVRIVAGVGLRYLGKGKSFKGVASAAGLVSLAVFGPIYAMWFVDFVVREVVARMG